MKSKIQKWFCMGEVKKGMNPTFMYSYANAAYVEKFFKNIGIKATPQKYLVIFEKGGYRVCFPEENYEKCSRETLKKIIENPDWALKLNQELIKRSDEFFDFAEKTTKINLDTLKDKQLVKLLEDFYKKQTIMHTMGWLGNVVEFSIAAFSNYLLQFLEKRVRKIKSKLKPKIVFSTLTTPIKEGFAQKEYKSYLTLLEIILTSFSLKNIFLKTEAKFIENELQKIKAGNNLLRQIDKHARKFGWLGYGVEGPGWKRDYYIELLCSLVKEKVNPQKMKKELIASTRNVLKNQKKYIKLLKLDAKERKLFEVAQGFVYTKGYRKDVIFHGFWCLESLHKEFGERTNLALKQVRYIYPWEYKKIIKEKEKSAHELNNRFNFHIYYSEKKKNLILSGEKARQFLQKFRFKIKKGRKKVTKLEGDCASPGKVRGIVAIINTPDENKKIEKADIIVSSMTNPNLMPAIRKAKAIVTDIGGLTCHAAIVSREFGIPCVVGTKIATQILKDGDVIEVDATHGIVNIIKQ